MSQVIALITLENASMSPGVTVTVEARTAVESFGSTMVLPFHEQARG
jgi:hypothetical protein